MKKCTSIVIKGKIQKVSYRDFVKENAEKLNIEGTVQNAHDGTIIINACGQSDKLEDFLDALYQGPTKSQVEEITEKPIIQVKNFRGIFRIIG